MACQDGRCEYRCSEYRLCHLLRLMSSRDPLVESGPLASANSDNYSKPFYSRRGVNHLFEGITTRTNINDAMETYQIIADLISRGALYYPPFVPLLVSRSVCEPQLPFAPPPPAPPLNVIGPVAAGFPAAAPCSP